MVAVSKAKFILADESNKIPCWWCGDSLTDKHHWQKTFKKSDERQDEYSGKKHRFCIKCSDLLVPYMVV